MEHLSNSGELGARVASLRSPSMRLQREESFAQYAQAHWAHEFAKRKRFSGARPSWATCTNSWSMTIFSSRNPISPVGRTTPTSTAPSSQRAEGQSLLFMFLHLFNADGRVAFQRVGGDEWNSPVPRAQDVEGVRACRSNNALTHFDRGMPPPFRPKSPQRPAGTPVVAVAFEVEANQPGRDTGRMWRARDGQAGQRRGRRMEHKWPFWQGCARGAPAGPR